MVRLSLHTFIYTEGEGAIESRVGSKEERGREDGRVKQGEAGRGGGQRHKVTEQGCWFWAGGGGQSSLREMLGMCVTAAAPWNHRLGIHTPEIVASYTRG